MKNFIVTIAAILYSTSVLAMFGVLQQQWVEGSNRYCKYSNGVIITVALHENCPVNID